MLDVNDDGYLSASEMKALIVGMRLEELDLDEDEAANKIVMEFDTSNDYRLELGEFVDGISRWIRKAINLGSASGMKAHGTMKFLDDMQNVRSIWRSLLRFHVKDIYLGIDLSYAEKQARARPAEVGG